MVIPILEVSLNVDLIFLLQNVLQYALEYEVYALSYAIICYKYQLAF